MLLALRVTAVIHALSFFAQPVLAGMFLSGQDTAMDTHRANATIVTTIALGMTVLALLARRRRLIGRQLPILLTAVLLLEYVEMAMGSSHILWVHIPLGVALFAVVTLTLPMIMKAGPATADTAYAQGHAS
ncbi:hypothetical protein GCM10009665_44990 [Kitasatospora nipponensis]|uniref:Uncharacterized protein n=1 Tax=Kitasatospora nipponensis TaxID=258049 RepID=A0ABP4H4G4_9ACTN